MRNRYSVAARGERSRSKLVQTVRKFTILLAYCTALPIVLRVACRGPVRSRRMNRQGSVYLGFHANPIDALREEQSGAANNDDDDVEDDIFEDEEIQPIVPMRGAVRNETRTERTASGAYGFGRASSDYSDRGSDEVDFFDLNSPQSPDTPGPEEPPARPARRALRRQGSVYEGFKGDAPKEPEGEHCVG